MKQNVAQNALVFGEISPSMYGRKKIEQYENGVKSLSDFFVRPQGGVTRRLGSRYALNVPLDGAVTNARVIPFNVKAATESYRLLITFDTEGIVRAFRDESGVISELEEPSLEFFDAPQYLHTTTPVGAPFNGRIALHDDVENFFVATGMGPYQLQAADATYSVPTGLSSAQLYWPLVQTTIDEFATAVDPDRGWCQQNQRHFPVYLGFCRSYSGAGNATDFHSVTGGLNSSKTIRLNPVSALGTPRNWIHSWCDSSVSDETVDNIRYEQDGPVLYVLANQSLFTFFLMELSDGVISSGDVVQLVMRKQAMTAHGPLKFIDSGSNPGALDLTEVGGNPLTTPNEAFTINQTDDEDSSAIWSVATSFGIDFLIARLASGTDWMYAKLTSWAGVGFPYAFDSGVIFGKPFSAWTGPTESADAWAFKSLYPALIGLSANSADTDANNSIALALFQGRVCLSGGADPEILALSGTDGIGCARFLPITRDGSEFTSGSYTAGAFNVTPRGFGEAESEIAEVFAIEDDLFIVTGSRVHRLFAPAAGTGVHNANFAIRPLNRNGGGRVQAAKIEDAAIYASSNLKRLYRIRFGGNEEGYTTEELTIYCDHILEDRVLRLANQPDPVFLLWALKKQVSGVSSLVSFTLNRSQLIQGASRHQIAGDSTATPVDICVMRSDVAGQDETEWITYLLMKRNINSSDVWYLESLKPDFDQSKNLEPTSQDADAGDVYMDCHLVYKVPSGTITNVPANTFDHLIGETVGVYVDGAYRGTDTINGSGQLTTTLSPGATVSVTVGYVYTSEIVTLAREARFNFGDTDLSQRTTKRVALLMHQSYGGKIGAMIDGVAANVDPIEYDGTTPALYSGSREIAVESDTDDFGEVVIRCDEPYPMDINQIVYRIDYEAAGGPDS